MADNELLTIGQIADLLHEPPSRVAYVIGKHRLKAVKRVGIIRLFDSPQVDVIRQGIYDIRAWRC